MSLKEQESAFSVVDESTFGALVILWAEHVT